jgi:hypothetical protein
MADIFMLSEAKRSRSAKTSLIPVRVVRQKIGDQAVKQLLAVHAISGCDTTSALFSHGKGSVFRKNVQSSETVPLMDVLSFQEATHDAVAEAGAKLLLLLYGGSQSGSLNHLRYVTYMRLVSTSNRRPRPEKLPPTDRAAYFHSLRVHLQIVQGKCLIESDLNPTEWGWTLSNDCYVPVATDRAVAPDDILNVNRCQCQVSSPLPCSSARCSCRSHGLPCVAACKHCYGDLCENVAHVTPLTLPDDDAVEDDSDAEQVDDVRNDMLTAVDDNSNELCFYDEYELELFDEELVESL